jgi:hypothetical protein
MGVGQDRKRKIDHGLVSASMAITVSYSLVALLVSDIVAQR